MRRGYGRGRGVRFLDSADGPNGFTNNANTGHVGKGDTGQATAQLTGAACIGWGDGGRLEGY